MKIRTKYSVILIFSLLGFAVSSYLAYTHFRHISVPCTVTHGCEVVLNSKYSAVFGIPLPVLGLLFYTTVLGLAVAAFRGKQSRMLVTIVLGLGALAALSFLSIQFFVLQKICQYCLVTDMISIFLFLWDINTSVPSQEEPVSSQ